MKNTVSKAFLRSSSRLILVLRKYILRFNRMINPIGNNMFKRVFSLLLFVISIFFFSVCKVHAVLEPTLVKDFNKNKIYKIDIEYKGMKYTEEILGTRDNFNRVVVDISEEGVKEFDWKIPVYIFLGVILVLILFFLFSKDKKEEQQVPLD